MAETSPGELRIKPSPTLASSTTGGGTESLPSSEESDLSMKEDHFATQKTTTYQLPEKCINGWCEMLTYVCTYMSLAPVYIQFHYVTYVSIWKGKTFRKNCSRQQLTSLLDFPIMNYHEKCMNFQVYQ